MKLEIISKFPSKAQKNSPPILFIHGAWHAVWCWDVNFLDYFTNQGFEVHAISLRGHGKSEGWEKLRWTRVADYVADLQRTIQEMERVPILVGHSMGGLVVQKYLENASVPGAVLLAPVPIDGVLKTALKFLRRHPLLFAKMNLTLSLQPFISTNELIRDAFFSKSISQEQLIQYAKNLQDESYLGFLDMLVFALPKPEKVKTPVLILGAEKDNIFSANQIRKTAEAYNTKEEIIPDMAHDMMVEPGWQAVADKIINWLHEQKLATS